MMRRLGWWVFALLFSVVPERCIHAQQRPPEMLIGLRPEMKLILLEYHAPAEYEKWWMEIAACEKLPLPVRHYFVQFFAVNGREFTVLNDPFTAPWDFAGWAIGYADPWSDQIYLAFPYMREEEIVKHEMLHQLMKWAGEVPGHPESRYGLQGIGKCGIVPYRREGIDEK